MTYVNYGSVTAIGILFPLVAGMTLGLRLYGTVRQKQKMHLDDTLLIPAFILLLGVGISLAVGAQMRFIGGHTLHPLTPLGLQLRGKHQYVFWIVHSMDIGLIKLSLLLFFRRIFRGRGQRTMFDYVNWTLITLTALWTVCAVFLSIFECGLRPEGVWTGVQALRTECIDTFAMNSGLAIISWVLDIAILVEPLSMIKKLNMPTRRKVQAYLVFLLSGFAVVAGLLRMIMWIQVMDQDITNPVINIVGITQAITDTEGGDTKPLTPSILTIWLTSGPSLGVTAVALFWAYVEIGVGFLVACLPPCAHFIDKISPGPLYSKLRSKASLISLARRSGNRRGSDEAPMPPLSDHIDGEMFKLRERVSSSKYSDDVEMGVRPGVSSS